jgi:hypothetical protein
VSDVKALWKFYWDCGRMRGHEDASQGTHAEVKAVVGKELHFGEVLGKHSEVFGMLEEKDVTWLTDDAAFVSKFEEYGCASGFNPLEYVQEEENDAAEEEEAEG